MRTVAVVVSHVLREHHRQVPLADDEHPVGALPAYGAHPALRERVRARCLRRSLDHLDAGAGKHRVEDGREFGVAIAQEEPQTLPLPKTPSTLVRAGAEMSEMLARLLGAGPGRNRRSMRHDGLPCYCDWRTWV